MADRPSVIYIPRSQPQYVQKPSTMDQVGSGLNTLASLLGVVQGGMNVYDRFSAGSPAAQALKAKKEAQQIATLQSEAVGELTKALSRDPEGAIPEEAYGVINSQLAGALNDLKTPIGSSLEGTAPMLKGSPTEISGAETALSQAQGTPVQSNDLMSVLGRMSQGMSPEQKRATLPFFEKLVGKKLESDLNIAEQKAKVQDKILKTEDLVDLGTIPGFEDYAGTTVRRDKLSGLIGQKLTSEMVGEKIKSTEKLSEKRLNQNELDRESRENIAKERIAYSKGLSEQRTEDARGKFVVSNFKKDYRSTSYNAVIPPIDNALTNYQSYLDGKVSNRVLDDHLMVALAKLEDPKTGVREAEVARISKVVPTFSLDNIERVRNKYFEGGSLDENTRREIVATLNIIKDLRTNDLNEAKQEYLQDAPESYKNMIDPTIKRVESKGTTKSPNKKYKYENGKMIEVK